VTHGTLKGNVYPVSKPRVILGRSGADIVVDDAEVSRQHCALKISGSGALLTDLGSTNGTFVKNERIRTCTLQHLDEFRIGTTTLVLTLMPKR
jgi:pSer/pThr/pTyr-binding forkhead associated (FHA) protein